MEDYEILRLLGRVARYGIEAKLENLALRVALREKGLLTDDDLARSVGSVQSLPGASLIRSVLDAIQSDPLALLQLLEDDQRDPGRVQ